MSIFVLKVIACLTMFIGHIPFALPDLSIGRGMACIGKLSFPIFAFLIYEGYVQNKNFSKYLTRLFVFAIISQIFAQFLFFGTIKVLYFNMFFTLAFGLLSIRIVDKCKNKYVAYFISFLLAFFAELLNFDFGAIGVLLILSFFVLKSKPTFKTLVQAALFFILFVKKSTNYAFTLSNTRYVLFLLMFSIIGLVFPNLYNGKKGNNSKFVQIMSYCFYPLHLIILCLLKLIVL